MNRIVPFVFALLLVLGTGASAAVDFLQLQGGLGAATYNPAGLAPGQHLVNNSPFVTSSFNDLTFTAVGDATVTIGANSVHVEVVSQGGVEIAVSGTQFVELGMAFLGQTRGRYNYFGDGTLLLSRNLHHAGRAIGRFSTLTITHDAQPYSIVFNSIKTTTEAVPCPPGPDPTATIGGRRPPYVPPARTPYGSDLTFPSIAGPVDHCPVPEPTAAVLLLIGTLLVFPFRTMRP